ncbi:pyridine nucleotide transhydrogenase [Geminocystis sp. GBBB08]|uniref:pyridine nucleotide transhydrogenase n=1 Tax=Geminocystis sp. GBBB08 TaxID=2604140 RepID=UPI0027E343CD|nr:pyridine nucleotide transhydrogenase [Geminocystis sp. GBBB08]MBL1209094.1 NAD(P)-dependent oxidoreductase [Geminocystis sp. GBBB08]
MKKAIIGYTGFVGNNVISQTYFDDFYNSKNIESIKGKKYDLVVCAGTPAVKWLANKEPIKDKENLKFLMDCLSELSTNKLILISTVDVYPNPINVDEDTIIDEKILQPYGKHRLELENFVRDKFDSLIIRLPGLFGKGLKKNIIYDFMNDNIGDWINKDSVFQFYNLANLWQDIAIALDHNLELINFATEPISVAEVAKEAFGLKFNHTPETNPAYYDMQTKYADLFNHNNLKYLSTKSQTLEEIKDFISSQNLK